MNALRGARLDHDQRLLLLTLGDSWHETGTWPKWGYVQDIFDQRRSDADTVLRSLPRIGIRGPFGAGYGYTTAAPDRIGEDDIVRLTLAACYALPSIEGWAGGPFIRVLHHMIHLWENKDTSPSKPGKATLSSVGLASQLDLCPAFVTALPELLSYEPAITTPNEHAHNGWALGINRSIRPYRDVQTIHDYLDITCTIVEDAAAELRAQMGGAQTYAPVIAAPSDERQPYLEPGLIADLEEGGAEHPRFKTNKLVAMCRALNSSHQAQNPYACMALIRAIMDHIAPAFGHKDFKNAAAQHSFRRTTDKEHAQRLASYKGIGNDMMHRQIDTSGPVTNIHDVPPPTLLGVVLHEVLTILGKPSSTQT
ncbi:hypothetical protein [Streptomyces sp. NPDC013740]|uniref:hypothetical protein n=1 Tax=Streptomyces sp. NPDC013740 TaxID=3364867 RepID=UPI0036F87DE3